MRKLCIPLIGLLAFQLSAQVFSATQWQNDLSFLQTTVHEQYPFLFKKVTAEEFDAAVARFYDTIPQLQEHEIVVGFAEIIGLFKYGHTRMRLSDGPATFHKLPLNIYQFTDGFYITSAHKDYKALVGAKLLEIEGEPLEKVLEAVYPVVPVENEQFFKAYGINYVLLPEVLHARGITETLKKELLVTVEEAGKQETITVAATPELDFPLRYGEVIPESNWVSVRDMSADPMYLQQLEKHYFFKYLPEEKALYIRYSQVFDDPTESIAEFYARIFGFLEANEVDRMVLDLRLNGGGNNYNNKQVITGIIENKEINTTGKLYVIIGRRTFSACQNLVNELVNYTNAIFVGEPTGENINFFGDNKKVVLPNSKLPVYLSFAWWQDLPQWENGPYTAPDIAVETNFIAYQANQDPVLEKALSFDGTGYVRDPLGYLRGLFMEKKFALLESEAVRLVNDPLYANYPFESEINRSGFSLLDGDQVQEAIYVLGLCTKLFPESSYSWYSLGEAYYKAADMDKAKAAYGKSRDLDPEGTYGKYAAQKLEEIAGQ